MIMNAIRSFIFYIVFFTFTFLYFPVFALTFLLSEDIFSRCIIRSWMSGFILLSKKILKIDYKLINFDLIKKSTSPIIVAPKHQSMWETFLISAELGENMCAVLKKEIKNYFFISKMIKNTKGILIDHKKTLEALKKLIEEGTKCVNEGYNICIFPEGERVKPGAAPTYHGGLFFLYKKLQLPVVTIALNAGVFWPTKKFIKKAGCITVKVTGIIDPGLTKEEFNNKLFELIETPSAELSRHP